MPQNGLIQEFKNMLFVSTAYILLFILTFSFLMPVQSYFFNNLPLNISLLFLPHGVRILTIYLHGWRGIVYLMPGHVATYLLFEVGQGTEKNIGAPALSIVASFLAVSIAFRTWKSHYSSNVAAHTWLILFAGALASLGNGMGHALLFGGQIDATFATVTIGFMIGDISGLFFLIVVLVMVNRALRRSRA